MVVFSDQEFINRWKAGLRNKIYVKSILKGKLPLCENTSANHNSRKQRQQKLPMFLCSPHKISMVFRLRRDFVERKIVDQLKTNKYTAT